jgi:hypothetical protein
MLAEKFFLLLETIRSHTYDDGAPRVTSASRHVPINLIGAKGTSPRPQPRFRSAQNFPFART